MTYTVSLTIPGCEGSTPEEAVQEFLNTLDNLGANSFVFDVINESTKEKNVVDGENLENS